MAKVSPTANDCRTTLKWSKWLHKLWRYEDHFAWITCVKFAFALLYKNISYKCIYK